MTVNLIIFFFFSSRRRHTRSYGDWSSDVCSSDLRKRRVRPAPEEGGEGRSGPAGAGRASARRPPRVRATQAVPALRRAAPAGGAGPGPGQPPAGAAAGRAAGGAGPEAAQADAARAEGDPDRGGRHVPP